MNETPFLREKKTHQQNMSETKNAEKCLCNRQHILCAAQCVFFLLLSIYSEERQVASKNDQLIKKKPKHLFGSEYQTHKKPITNLVRLKYGIQPLFSVFIQFHF